MALASAQVRLHWLEAKPWIVCTLGLLKSERLDLGALEHAGKSKKKLREMLKHNRKCTKMHEQLLGAPLYAAGLNEGTATATAPVDTIGIASAFNVRLGLLKGIM